MTSEKRKKMHPSSHLTNKQYLQDRWGATLKKQQSKGITVNKKASEAEAV